MPTAELPPVSSAASTSARRAAMAGEAKLRLRADTDNWADLEPGEFAALEEQAEAMRRAVEE